MTIEETKEAIRIMQAFVDGREIECKCEYRSNTGEWVWKSAPNPTWDFYNYDYRIKPEPKYRPFRSEEELTEAIKEHGYFLKSSRTNTKKIIREFDDERIWIGTNELGDLYKSVFNCFTFVDGTPFGKLEEEE